MPCICIGHACRGFQCSSLTQSSQRGKHDGLEESVNCLPDWTRLDSNARYQVPEQTSCLKNRSRQKRTDAKYQEQNGYARATNKSIYERMNRPMNDSWLGFTGPRRLDGPDLSLDLGQSTNCHLYTQSSSPFTQQSHDTCSQQYTEYHEAQSLIVFGPQWIKQEVSGKKLDQSRVNEDLGTDGIQDTRYDVGGVRIWIVGRAHTQTNGNRNWSGHTVCGA